ncbi:MAG TPA: RrF2 family transcriptional regulator [Anaerolineae bacterium]|nr:RrF2 family transcriptional regulator [Anaerolineae bacterium]
MKLSAREQYGLRAMIELGRRYGEGPISLSDVAEIQGISLGYLEQIAPLLKAANLVESTRGVRGGYELTRAPWEITVGDVVRALEEGYIMPLKCIPGTEGEDSCTRTGVCTARDVWKRMHEGMVEVLDSTTLADLVEPISMG